VADPFIVNIEEEEREIVIGVWGILLLELALIVKKQELALPGLK
jgi:hypothetical protein